MNRILHILIFIALAGSSFITAAQDTLPKFNVRNVGNDRYIIGWTNPFPNMSQISIQRSHDSLRNYTTILSVADPKAIQNGYADTKAPNDHMYYRLFFVLEGGIFYFTEAKKPILDTSASASKTIIETKILSKIDSANLKKIEAFVPSFYVYTKKEGVFINLPDADDKKYSIKFFEENNDFLFEIKGVKQTALTLDKANFHRAGWYRFELYNDEKLVEKHRFYLAKDF